jgi:hypothetical protein
MRLFAILAVTAVVAGCGSTHERSAEEAARAWSAALNRSDNEAAANLFGSLAEVIQNGRVVLKTHRDAVHFNASLPCGGRITRVLQEERNEVLVVFRLTERPGHICDAPGADAAAVFRVEHGKIVVWHQVDVPAEPPPL